MLFHPFPQAFGLDIGDLSIKVAQLSNQSSYHREPRYAVRSLKSTRVPAGLIEDGVLREPEKIRRYIKHLLTRSGEGVVKEIRSPWVVASLPETQSFITLLHIDKPATDILEEDVYYHAEQHIPFGDDSYYLDWQIMDTPNNSASTTVLVGAVPRVIADSYTYLLESVGLTVVALEIEALAITRAMITADKKYEKESRLLLDIGAARSSCVVYDNNTIQFSTSLHYSGETVSQTLMTELGMTHEEAEAHKAKFGLNVGDQPAKPRDIQLHHARELSKEVQGVLDFYYSHFHHANPVTHITMCGGGANMPYLDTYLGSKLGVDAAPGHAWKNLYLHKTPPADNATSRAFATALGLGLRAADNLSHTNDIL